MPSAPKIPRNRILEGALEIVIRDGYGALNIKTLAKELGCSTQPISWHFGNMEGLRKELAQYALTYANGRMLSSMGAGLGAFLGVGAGYVDMAFDQPRLFQYLYMSGDSGLCAGNLDVLMNGSENAVLVEQIAEQLHISSENAGRFLQNTMVYTHGLASFVASGVIRSSKKEVMDMVKQTAGAFLVQAGVKMNGGRNNENQ